ncbi:FG-GAP repeat domain-containing protein [Anaeromyxobacter oryzae]|uniref:Lipoprotein n=1 Tax=Anaeromyxobacter oryzae TaxID=2918170 RepID=A0ABN6N4A3_9BACT|nr:VCBS repeat-containing protein [Anaeromyxobacter oryzae]BDG06787.1 hypothetical protein AMOR_57830 [Anaeromyxobacter oryzae]
MRRLLAVTAGLLALSCAGRTKAPAVSSATAPAEAPRAPIPGMEHKPGEIVAEYDLNRDGRPDVWKYVTKDADGKEVLLRKEKDLNGDGRIDTWEAYGADGALTLVVYDLDFDGKPDVTLTYEKGQLVKKEYALGFDGASRSSSFFEKGKLVRKERDTNGDGKVDYWEYWENGEIDRIGVDLDGDGQVDRWETRKAVEGGETTAAQK